MMSNLTISFIITVIGMGLVFIAILLLWALMEFIVKLTAKESAQEGAPAGPPGGSPGGSPGGVQESRTPTGFKQRVAAAAVGVAMALRRGSAMASSSAVTGGGSSQSVWLAAGRLAALNQPSAVRRRKA